MIQRRIAALYVERNGAYFGLEHVDPWDKDRDARLYRGPWPVVAHPPCERWGRYHAGSPTVIARTGKRLQKGDDGGCFMSALASVREFGGVLEHPEGSHAWRAAGLNIPPRSGGWINADWDGGWTCCVEQGAYGHEARKATWLLAYGTHLPSLDWGRAEGDFLRLESGYHSAAEREAAKARGENAAEIGTRIPHNRRAATPLPFRDLLIDLALTVYERREVAA